MVGARLHKILTMLSKTAAQIQYLSSTQIRHQGKQRRNLKQLVCIHFILSDLSVSLEKSFIIIYVLLRHIASNLPLKTPLRITIHPKCIIYNLFFFLCILITNIHINYA